ncbi:MAG: histidine phosphatase family protein [Mycobacteriales bacterium]
MPARHVHLVRHGLPLVDVEAAASDWVLDPAAAGSVRALRGSGRLPERASWFSSPEPKARETARLLTDGRIEVVEALREQVRLHVGWIDDFDGVLAQAFAHPERPAYDGWEPLAATRLRVVAAVRDLLRRNPTGDLVLVGHGTSLALVAAELTGTSVNPCAPAAMGFPDVVTVRMSSPAEPGPLSVPVVAAGSAALTIAEFAAWRGTGTVGWVVGTAGVLAALVAVPRRTRDLGVSLLAGVLVAAFLITGLVIGYPLPQ